MHTDSEQANQWISIASEDNEHHKISHINNLNIDWNTQTIDKEINFSWHKIDIYIYIAWKLAK